MMKNHIKRIGTNSTIYLLGDLIYKGIALLLIPLYTRFLSTDEYGTIETLRAISSILMIIFDFGLGSALNRFYFECKGPSERSNLIGSTFISIISLGFTSALIISFIAPFFSSFLFKIPYYPFISFTIWTSFLVIIPSALLLLFQTKEQSARYVIFQVFQALTTIGMIIYFVIGLRQGAAGQVKGMLFASIILFSSSILFILKEGSFFFSFRILKESLKFGLPLIPHILSWWILNLSSRLILQKYVPLSEVGIFSLAYNIGIGMQLVVAAVNKAWAPFLFSTADNDKNAPNIFSTMTTYYMMVIIFLGLLISVFSHEIISVLSTSKFYRAEKLVPIITLSFVIIGMYLMVTTQIFYRKKTKYLIFITGSAATVNVILNFFLIPRFGIIGSAFATLFSFLVFFLNTYFYSMKIYPIPYEKFKIIGMFLAAFSIYFIQIYFNHTISNYLIEVIIKCLLVLLFPLLLLFMPFFSATEKQNILHFLKNRTSKILGYLHFFT